MVRGERLAAFTWVQSLVREDAHRTLLFQLDAAIQRLPHSHEMGQEHIVRLTNIYHNLLRRWADI